MTSPRTHVLFATLLACLTLTSSAYPREVQWRFRSPLGNVDSSPAVADINGDGRSDLVLTTTAGMVIALDSDGRQIWMQGVQIPISIPPTVVDLIEDATPEVLVVNQSGRIFCISGETGDPIWQYDLPGEIAWGATALATFDLDGDGRLEIVTGDDEGHVVCLSAEGELLWQYDGDHGYSYCPAIGPIGDNEAPAILIGGSEVPLICLNADGAERWRVAGEGDGASPVIADVDGDGRNEVISAIENAVALVDGEGRVLWTHSVPKTIDSAIAVADADEDGELEIYAIDLSGTVVSIAPDGSERWSANVRERVRRSPGIADVDGDGNIEVLVAGYSGELYVFTGDGELKETVAMVHNTNASPTIADLRGDGTPFVVYASGAGEVLAYKWPGAAPGAKVEWPEYRFGPGRRGAYEQGAARSPVRVSSIDFGKLYAGSNDFAISVENPEQTTLRVVVTLARTGKKSRERTLESADESIDFGFAYSLGSAAPTTLSISCSVYDGEIVVARRVLDAHIVPFRKEVADLKALLNSVGETARRLPSAFAILGETAGAVHRLAEYEGRAAVAGTLSDIERRELRDGLRRDLSRFERLLGLSDIAATAHESGRWPLRLSAANPWAPFGGLDEVLEGRLGDPGLRIEGFRGETESAALNVVNWSSHAKSVRVEIASLTLEGGEVSAIIPSHEVVRVLEVVDVPTQTLDLVADALPEINQARVLTLPGWGARQIWFSIDTGALTPGTWTTEVRLRTLDVDSRSFTAPLEITVWETELADTNVLQHCNWGYIDNSRLKHHESESLAERAAHGNNVFVTGFVPRARFDDHGKLVGEIDYARHDEFVSRYSPRGLILFQNTGGISGPGDPSSEAYRKAYLEWMKEWVAHLMRMGVDYGQYAMYPVDEPGLNEGLVDRYLLYAKLTREADPRVVMYTDPVGRITEEELHSMTPYVDIWCPNRNGFLLNSGADKLEIMKQSGATLWNYECEGNAKHQSPLGYYRAQAWLAWHHGLSGIGFWSYCTSAADPWFRPTNTLDYLLVYQGDGVVASKRWEAVRDGVEDYAMLFALREATAAARRSGRAPEAAAEAAILLATGASEIASFCGLDSDGNVPGKGGQPAVRLVADRRFRAVQRIRRGIARLMPELVP